MKRSDLTLLKVEIESDLAVGWLRRASVDRKMEWDEKKGGR